MKVEGNKPPEPYPTDSELWMERAADVEAVIRAEEHRPMMVRSAYYGLLSSPRINNWCWFLERGKNKGEPIRDTDREPKLSDMVIKIVKYLRLSKRIPFDFIIDESRIFTEKEGESDYQGFAERYSSFIFPTYNGCTAESQPVYVEVWIEKNGLVHIAQKAADNFCRHVVGCKGRVSVDALHKFSLRAKSKRAAGHDVKLFYYGDLDPAGWDMHKTIQACLHAEHEHNVPFVDIHRMGLLPEQVTPDMVPISLKGNEGLKDNFRQETGLNVGYEINCWSSNELIERIKDDLRSVTDMELYYLLKKRGEEINKRFIRVEEKIVPGLRSELRKEGLLPDQREMR